MCVITEFSRLRWHTAVTGDVSRLRWHRAVTGDVSRLRWHTAVTGDISSLRWHTAVTGDVRRLRWHKAVTGDVSRLRWHTAVTGDVSNMFCLFTIDIEIFPDQYYHINQYQLSVPRVEPCRFYLTKTTPTAKFCLKLPSCQCNWSIYFPLHKIH